LADALFIRISTKERLLMKTLFTLARWSAVLVAVVALAVVVQPAVAGTFSLSTTGGTWNTIYAQGFSPAVDPSPNPGLSAGDTVYLDQFEFYKSGNSDSASNFELAIVDTMWYDYTNQLTTSSSALVGLSSNTIASTGSLLEGDAITFNFDSLPLAYGEDYAAVAVTDDGSGNLTPVLFSAWTVNWVEDPPGTWLPAPNYGGLDVYEYATSGTISGGYLQTYDHGGDAVFTATLHAVPEPTSLLLVLGGAALAVIGCRRRS
jgi:hypothetical protein